MRIAFVVLIFLAVAFACSDNGDKWTDPSRTFIFAMHGDDSMHVRFVATTHDTSVIRLARAELQKVIADRHLFPSGPIERGADPYGWKWHFVSSQWHLTEAAIEVCDGTPAMVDSNLAYWVDTVGQFCPWQAYVLQEVLPAPD